MKISSIILLLAFLISACYSDSIPQAIAFGGNLLNTSTNLSLNGTYNVSFNLYTVYSGGSSIWNNWTNVTTDNYGNFIFVANTSNLSYDQPYFIGWTVQVGSEQVPRIPIVSVPDAFRSNISDYLNPNSTVFSQITSVNASVTGLLSSNTTTNQRVDNLNVSVVGLLTSNTSTNQRVDAINTSVRACINNVTSLDQYIIVANNTPNQTVNLSLNITTLNANYYNQTGANATFRKQADLVNFTNVTAFPSSNPNCANGQFVQNLSLSSGGVLTSVCQTAITSNNITGNGAANNVSKWSSASNLVSSSLYDNGTNVGLFTSVPTANLSVNGTLNATTIYQGANQVAGTGNSASCTYGIQNLTTVSSGAPSLTCAAQQGTVTSIGTTSPITGGTITTSGTIGINVLNFTQSGYVTNVTTGLNVTKDGNISLANTNVAPSTYGGTSTVGVFTLNAQGQATSASNTTISIPYANLTGIPTSFGNWSNSTTVTSTDDGIQIRTTANHPTCNSAARGTIWGNQSASGTADYLYWCAKAANDSYNWVQIAYGQ